VQVRKFSSLNSRTNHSRDVVINCRKKLSMRKYLPYILIITSLILIVINIIEKESFQQYISSFFLIAAMIIIIYENKKKERNE